ncbi:MAG: hypothetical protein M3R43_12455 [Acidobacteriota bacterium]|nr:hypothetical protein [Acidobacteriota bacterium]
MAKLTIVFGVLLLVLGAAGFLLTGREHPTALIPAAFGLVLFVCGFFANTEDSKRRMLWMHIAVSVGLIGFLGSGAMVVMKYIWAHGEPFINPAAVEAQAAMCVLCAIFVGLCVRSFIAARRGRAAVS